MQEFNEIKKKTNDLAVLMGVRNRPIRTKPGIEEGSLEGWNEDESIEETPLGDNLGNLENL